MEVGIRLRQLREFRKLSQGDIEQRTGLLRCYISRVENGHTTPALETLEKMSRALEVPLYQLFTPSSDTDYFFDGQWERNDGWPLSRKDRNLFVKMRNAVSRMAERDRRLLLFAASKMSGKRTR